jgi:hypothetical protein
VESPRQSGFAGSLQPASVFGLQLLHVWPKQYGSLRPATHSPSFAHGRHCVVEESQIGDVLVVQSAALLQLPQAPPAVQTSGLMQSSGDVVQALHVFVAASQIGVLPLQPAFICDGSQAAHWPPTHLSLPSVLPAQSVESRHAAHAAGGPAAQNFSAACPLHTRFEPGAHSHVRAVHAAARPAGHATPHCSHSFSEVL